jgi:hypothetical protein
MKQRIAPLLSIFLFSLLCPFFGRSQASLAAENMIDDIKVTTKYGKQKVYSVCQDARIPTQWYYMPNELRLAEEVDVRGKVKPKFTILRYQYQDIITKEAKEGGILVAAFTYAIEPEVVDAVKRQIIAKRPKIGANITLSAIPLNTSTIDFLASSKDFIGDVDAKALSSGGATSASQEMVISFNLTVLGASVFKALVTGSGGIPIRGNISYNGLSAPCGFKINGNWSNVYEYMEKNTKVEAGIRWSWLSIGGGYSKNQVREELKSIKNMKVEIIDCPTDGDGTGTGANTANANLDMLIAAIQKEVFSDTLMNRAAELAKLGSMLKDPVINGDKETVDKIKEALEKMKSIQFGGQRAIKDIKRRRTGVISYDYSRQRVVLRNSTIGGLLSLSKYGMTEEQLFKEGYIVDVDVNRDFPSVIIGLPNINPDYEIKTIVLEVAYKNSDGKTHSEARSWDMTKGWITPTGKEAGYMRFNLIGEKDKKRVQEPEFDIKLQVVSKLPNASFVIQKKVKLSSGEKYIDAIELLTKQYVVDGSGLDFAKLTNEATDLAFVKLIFNKGAIKINKDIKPFFKDGQAGPPNPLYFLLPNDNAQESVKVTFTQNNGNTKDRSEPVMLGDNTLSNFEWKNN